MVREILPLNHSLVKAASALLSLAVLGLLTGCMGTSLAGYHLSACVEPAASFAQQIKVDIGNEETSFSTLLPAQACSQPPPTVRIPEAQP